MADYVRGPAATRGAIAAGGASVAFALILSLDSCRSRRNPVRFPYSHVIPKSIPTGFSERLTLWDRAGMRVDRTVCALPVRRGQLRRSGCSISVIAGHWSQVLWRDFWLWSWQRWSRKVTAQVSS